MLLARLEHAAHRLREAGAAADRAREEAEAARDKAETAGRAKSDFLSVMSHELRTPMTGVLGLVDLLAKEPLTDNQKINLDLARQSGQHLLNVINNVLDFSKIESGKLEIESTIFAVRSLFDEVCATTQPLCRVKGIEFEEDYSERILASAIGDPTKIRQVSLNLVGNAIKFTDEGKIRIIATHRSIGEDELLLRIEVQDSGIGIAEENQAEVFTAFTQEDKSTARRYGGSGLGLAISRRLVTAMGGTIGFTSSTGSGSSFWFEIPLLEHYGSDVAAPIPCRPSDLQPRRILVAEDIPLIRSIIRSMLASDHHTLIFAQDGAEVVELAKQGCFDLILMDVQMPVMDGVEATRAIRRLQGPERNVPIIALTANVYESERRRYLEAGMNSCIAKPIDWGSLNEAIARYTVGRRDLVSGNAEALTPPPQQFHLIDDRKLQSLQKRLGSELESLGSGTSKCPRHLCLSRPNRCEREG
ncbi:ATP-binding protein [Methylobacterium phyllosphaerae]